MNQDEQVTPNENEQPVNHPGVLIDNNTGEETEPHPLMTGGISDDAADGTQDEAETPEAPESQEEVTPPATPPASVAQETPPQPTQVVEDPGEFQPKDYSFDVTLADGSVIKIEKPEDIANIPQDADFGSPKNFLEVQANYSKMVSGIDADKREYEANKKTFDDQQAQVQQQEEYIASIENSIKYLETKGSLPPVPAQYEDADWNNSEVAKQPGVKERVEIFTHMAKENAARSQHGLPPMTALEAYSELKNKAFEEAQAQRTQQQNDKRKKQGAMVGGQSAPAPASGNGGMIVGSGGSLRDIG